MPTHTHLLRNGALTAAAAMALLVSTGTAATADNGAKGKGAGAEIEVDHDCTSVSVTSTKDISNVVLRFADGDVQKLDGLSGRSGSFRGTGGDAGETITTVWVKSGNNASGDGPGYGERFEFGGADCGEDDSSSAGRQAPSDDAPTSSDEARGQDEDRTPDEARSADKDRGADKARNSDEDRGPAEDRRSDKDAKSREDTGTARGGDAAITVDADCASVDVTSTKDISNIVLRFADGDVQKLDGLSGRTGSFRGTGEHAGETITTVWVKSGNNASGDGPGYGERFDLGTAPCEDTGDGTADQGSETSTGDGSTGEGNDDQDATTGDQDATTDDQGVGEDATTDLEGVGDRVLDTTVDRTTTDDGRGLEATATPELPETEVRGATDERVHSAGDVRPATDSLPITGAGVLTALLAGLAAFGLGTGLVRRNRARA